MVTSKEFSINWEDFKKFAWEILVFFAPSFIWGITLIQTGEFGRHLFLIGAVPGSLASTAIRFLQYYFASPRKPL